MSVLDDEEVLLERADAVLHDSQIQKETERFLALGLFRRGQVSAVVYEDKEELLLKKLSEAWKLNLDYKTPLSQRLDGIIKNAKNDMLKEHESRKIHPIDCRTLRKGDAYGWLSAVSKASKNPILVIEHLTEIPDGDRSIYDDPAYVTNLLLRSWKNEDIYAGDLEIDRRQFTVILACRDIDAQEFERECALCSYGWCGDFDSYLEEWKNIATKHVASPKPDNK